VVLLGLIKQAGFYLFGMVICLVGLLTCVEGNSAFNDNLLIVGLIIAFIGIIIMVYAKIGLRRNKKINHICNSIDDKCDKLDEIYKDIDKDWKKIDNEWKNIDKKLENKRI
jgi:disulfide bond formation protein DsbB